VVERQSSGVVNTVAPAFWLIKPAIMPVTKVAITSSIGILDEF
jgi:hypothetical protein